MAQYIFILKLEVLSYPGIQIINNNDTDKAADVCRPFCTIVVKAFKNRLSTGIAHTIWHNTFFKIYENKCCFSKPENGLS